MITFEHPAFILEVAAILLLASNGHVGLHPQAVGALGGLKVQGRNMVHSGAFPGEEHSYRMSDEVLDAIKGEFGQA